MKDKIIKLSNGGTLIYTHTRQNNASAVEVGFSIGAVADKKPGTAHFLEHTLFKKTKNRTNKQIEEDRTKIVFLNASTSMDFLVVKFYRSNKLIDEAMNFASDILLNSVCDDEFNETEKGVIAEELAMCADNESRDVFVKNFKQAESNSKIASDIVGGSAQNILKIKFSDLLNFKKKHFVGNNFVCSIVTSLSLFKAKKLVNQNFVKFLPYDENYVKPKSYFEMTKIDKESSLKIYKNSQDKISVLISFKVEVNELVIFGKNFNYSFLAKYFSGAQGELFARLRNKGLIYRMDVDFSCFKNDSLFCIAFETSREKVKEIVDEIGNEISKILNSGIEQKYIDSYKKNFDYFADEKMPVKLTVNCHLNLMDFLSYGKVFKLTDRQKRKLKNEVCSEGVKEVAEKIFNKNNKIFISVLGNIDGKFVPNLNYFKNKLLIKEWPMEEINEDEIINSFKRIEKKLYGAIKKMPNKIQDSDEIEKLKERIKAYILQIGELKALLDEYEQIALSIEKLSGKQKGKEEINKTVVDLREDKVKLNFESAHDIINKIEEESLNKKETLEDVVVDGKIVGVKKKKVSKDIKEF